MPYLLSCVVISCDDPIDSRLCSSNTLSALANNKNVLFVTIVGLRCGIFLLRVLASDQNFAPCLLFQALLVEAFGTYKHTDVVDTGVLRDIELLLYL